MSAALQTGAIDHYRAAFGASGPAPDDPVSAARAAAFARFESLGFPTARDEAWKYTSLRRLESRRFAMPTATRAALAAADAGTVHLVDGRLARLGALPSGLRLRTLAMRGKLS